MDLDFFLPGPISGWPILVDKMKIPPEESQNSTKVKAPHEDQQLAQEVKDISKDRSI